MSEDLGFEISKLKAEIESIRERNNKVTSDKLWETSLTRKISILVITYLAASITMLLIGAQSPWLSALIPVLGYYLSTLSLPLIRKVWQSKTEK